jgi:cytochrome c peroxidase
MHDGSLETLEDVVRFYEEGGNPNPSIDPAMVRRRFTQQERADLIAFLRTLTIQESLTDFRADGSSLQTADTIASDG